MKKTLIKKLKEKEVIIYGNFTLRSGIKSKYYCDIKKALGQPDLLTLISKELSLIVPKNATAIAGSGIGGISLATLVSNILKLPLILIRHEVKDYGTQRQIEGYVPDANDIVCIVDDVYTTGSSIKKSKEVLKNTKVKYTTPVVVVKRSRASIPVSLVGDSDILK